MVQPWGWGRLCPGRGATQQRPRLAQPTATAPAAASPTHGNRAAAAEQIAVTISSCKKGESHEGGAQEMKKQ